MSNGKNLKIKDVHCPSIGFLIISKDHQNLCLCIMAQKLLKFDPLNAV